MGVGSLVLGSACRKISVESLFPAWTLDSDGGGTVKTWPGLLPSGVMGGVCPRPPSSEPIFFFFFYRYRYEEHGARIEVSEREFGVSSLFW